MGMLQTVYAFQLYALIAETDSGRHTSSYKKKDTNMTAVMKQIDRTFNIESLHHLYSGFFTTLHTKIT